MRKVILGLHGESFSGKDSIADYLISQKGWEGSFSFAGNLKEMCKCIFNLSSSDVYEQEGKKRLFDAPIKFNYTHLGDILKWMCRTHRNYKISDSDKTKVYSLLGTEFKTPRDILQIVGTDVCRQLIETYHVDVVKISIENSNLNKVVITDVRFPNEGNFIKTELAGQVLKVYRPSLKRDSLNRNHASETSMSDWEGFLDCIKNDEEGIHTLYRKIDEFLERHNL